MINNRSFTQRFNKTCDFQMQARVSCTSNCPNPRQKDIGKQKYLLCMWLVSACSRACVLHIFLRTTCHESIIYLLHMVFHILSLFGSLSHFQVYRCSHGIFWARNSSNYKKKTYYCYDIQKMIEVLGTKVLKNDFIIHSVRELI